MVDRAQYCSDPLEFEGNRGSCISVSDNDSGN